MQPGILIPGTRMNRCLAVSLAVRTWALAIDVLLVINRDNILHDGFGNLVSICEDGELPFPVNSLITMGRFTSFFLPLLVALAPVSNARCLSDAPRTFEAENAVLTGTRVESTLSGYTGTGYVAGFDEGSDKITFTILSSTTKLYDLSIRYAGIYGDKRTTIVLNGGGNAEVFFPATETFSSVSAGQVLLKEGNNTIEIVNNWGWYLIDSITIKPSTPRGEHNINPSLNNPNADASARTLYKYLVSIYGKKILSGQQDLSWAEWIKTQTGKTPALVSVDLMDYSPSRVERGTRGTSVEDAITHHQRGGIVSVLWHWNAPVGLYDTEEHRWWSGFYTDATDFDIAKTLANPNGANYTLIIRDIDAIAVQLKRLQAAGVPVLWRPLHEAEGGWFWWGAKGPEAAKQLWGILHDRLVEYHGLNNLIWVWNSIAPEWYPGDSTVDILSADVYAQGNGVSCVSASALR